MGVSYHVCRSGCGVLAPLLVDRSAGVPACLACGGPADPVESPALFLPSLTRALLSESEARAVERTLAATGDLSGEEERALERAYEKLRAAQDLSALLALSGRER